MVDECMCRCVHESLPIGSKFFRAQHFFLLYFHNSDEVDPNGTREALEQLSDLKPKAKPVFNYYITHLLLILSTLTYERNDKLVKQAAEILEDIDDEEQRQQAADLLLASEETIDKKAQFMGMRFEGVSELKSLGGPYAGLFYNEEAIVLVFKGTSVLAFSKLIFLFHVEIHIHD